MDSHERTERQRRVALAFYERLWQDRGEGAEKPLNDYLALFPDDQDTVAEEFLRARRDDSGTEGGAGGLVGIAGDARFGHYDVLRELGRGGQGIVYEAIDRRLDRRVALKVLTGLGGQAESHLLRFQREARIASKIDHPGICTVLESGIEAGTPFIAMRYVEGRSLAKIIADAGSDEGDEETFVDLSTEFAAGDDDASSNSPHEEVSLAAEVITGVRLREILEIFVKAARALDAAHEVGVLHRDIKPGNIMLDQRAEPVILDFGLAKEDEADGPTLTQTGDLFGTPAYMSPEQVAGHRMQLDRRSDVYSLGVTLFECLTLRRPFDEPTREALYQSILMKDPPNPRVFNRSIPSDLQVVLECVLEKERDKRYATALAFANDLEAVRDGRPIAARKVGMAGRSIRWARRFPVRAALIAVLIVGLPLVAGLSGYLLANIDKIEAQDHFDLERRVEVLVARGYYELHHIGHQEALAVFERALELLPDAGEALGGKALAQIAAGDAAAALSTVNDVVDRQPELRIVARRAARIEAGLEPFVAPTPQELAPDNAFAAYLLAQTEMARAHYLRPESESGREAIRSARDAFRSAIALSPRPRVVHHIGYTHASAHLGEARRDDPYVQVMIRRWSDNAHGWFWYADCCMDAPKKRLDAFERAENLHEGLVVASRRSDALYKLGQIDDAVRVCRESLARRPDDGRVHDELARALYWAGELEEAIAMAKKASSLDVEGQGMGLVPHAEALMAMGRHEEAILPATRFVELNPYAVSGLNIAAFAYAGAGKPERARPFVDRLIELSGEVPQALEAVSGVLGTLECHAESRPYLEAVLEQDPQNLSALLNLSIVHTIANEHGQAVAVAERAVALAPEQVRPHVHLGYAQLGAGDFDGATRSSDRALELDADHPQSLALKARLYEELDDLVPWAEWVEKRYAVEPSRETLMRLVVLWQRLGRSERALELLESRPNDDDARLLFFRAATLDSLGRAQESTPLYERILEIDPTHAESLCNLGLRRFAEGQRDEGLAMLARGHEEGQKRNGWPFPSEVWLLHHRQKWLNLSDGADPSAQVANLRGILKLTPEDPIAKLFLAKHLIDPETPAALRDTAEATTLFIAAKPHRPADDPVSQHVLAAVLHAAGETSLAVEIQKRVVNQLAGTPVWGLSLEDAYEALQRYKEPSQK